MNTVDEQDQEIAATLRRVAGHLARRGSEYLEHPVVEQPMVAVRGARGRRLLVGTAAAATLCVTALAGSFIGGASSGKVDVAKAAWSAIPSAPTDDLIKQTKNNCHITNETLAGYEGATVATFPQDMLEPALIDVRGTTTTAVYFTPSHAVLCVQFADGSVSVNDMPMGPNDGNNGNGWKTPGTITVKIDGNDGAESFMATMIVGYLPDGENWDPYIKVDGIETVAATKSERWGRYIAWIPGEVSGLVAMVNKLTDEGFDLPFGPEEEAPVQLSPETTIETKVSDQGVVTPLGDPATTVSPGD